MRPERRLQTAVAATLWVLVSGVIALYLVLFALTAASRFAGPTQEFTYGESWLLDGARRVARGEGLYSPPDHLPIMHIAYTPVYYVVVGALQRAAGDTGYTVGRAVSLVATLVGTLALAWSLKHITTRWWVGLLAAGFFLTQNVTALLWAPLHRVDSLALGLTLCGLALATAGRTSLAGVLFLLALLTKQTYLAGPLAVGVAMWPCRTALVRFGAIVGGGGLVSLSIAQWLTHGWFLWHTVSANGNQPDLVTFSALMGSFLQYNGLPVLAALATFALPAARGERQWRFYFVGCLAALPSLAKLGASSNYWLELSAATAACLALGSYRLAASPATRLIAPMVVGGSLFIAVPAYQAAAVEAGVNLAELLHPSSTQYLSLVGDTGSTPLRVEAGFVDEIARERGELLTDNSGLAVAAGKPIEFEFQIFQLLNAERQWSEQPILDAVAQRRFSLVALMHPLEGPVEGTRWTPALQTALRAVYAPAGQRSGFWLYRPRS
ncbi:MAG: hypothetical protein M3069_33535 [Chloroflexota bacterium]|nr:hypothetical protein [Chloroflexota bacterium]